jgi:hypothetical protein
MNTDRDDKGSASRIGNLMVNVRAGLDQRGNCGGRAAKNQQRNDALLTKQATEFRTLSELRK